MGVGKPRGVKRRSDRKATRKATAKSVVLNYKSNHKGLMRQHRKPVGFQICVGKVNKYHHPWSPEPPAVLTCEALIALDKSLGNNSNKSVESLGEVGAKWYFCTQVLSKSIEDGSNVNAPNGYFYSFSGPNVVDVVYVDPSNNHVYVLEAKGAQAGPQPVLLQRVSGNTQGTFAYLNEVANDMVASGDPLKVAVGNKILTAYNAQQGKLHYIGVHTTYTDNANGSVTANQPTQINNFNLTR